MTYAQKALAASKITAMIDAEVVDISSTDHVMTKPTRELFIGGAGTLKVIMASGKTVTFTGVVAGSRLPLDVTTVVRTGTSATNMMALF